MAKGIDTGLDELFQRPLGEFTVARNALAKTAGPQAAAVKALSKPPVAAWAVNQLYWKDRAPYDALVDAAAEMRRTHKAVIEGGRGDLRSAGREHEIALDRALKATLALMKDAGQPVTDATRQAILNTLRALPSDEAPGRLTRALAPGGFEMLAGIAPAKGRRQLPKGQLPKSQRPKDQHAAKARERKAEAERAVRDADQRARHAEFETARAAREAVKAERRVEQARTALEEAREELAAAEKAARTAAAATETAERRARDAQSALAAAKAALEEID